MCEGRVFQQYVVLDAAHVLVLESVADWEKQADWGACFLESREKTVPVVVVVVTADLF